MAAHRPNRSTETSILIRMSHAQKAAIEAATAKVAAELPAGARLPAYAFVLTAALERARSLGVNVPEKAGRSTK